MLQFLQNNLGTIAALLAVAFLVFLALRRMILDKKAGIGACGQKCATCARLGQCETPAPQTPACGGSCGNCQYSAACHKGEKQ